MKACDCTLYTFTWIIIRLVKCYFMQKIENVSNAVSSTRIVLWKKNAVVHQLPPTLSLDCFGVYFRLLFTRLDLEYNKKCYLLCEPNLELKCLCSTSKFWSSIYNSSCVGSLIPTVLMLVVFRGEAFWRQLVLDKVTKVVGPTTDGIVAL